MVKSHTNQYHPIPRTFRPSTNQYSTNVLVLEGQYCDLNNPSTITGCQLQYQLLYHFPNTAPDDSQVPYLTSNAVPTATVRYHTDTSSITVAVWVVHVRCHVGGDCGVVWDAGEKHILSNSLPPHATGIDQDVNPLLQ